jgi:hypothetical protein
MEAVHAFSYNQLPLIDYRKLKDVVRNMLMNDMD